MTTVTARQAHTTQSQKPSAPTTTPAPKVPEAQGSDAAATGDDYKRVRGRGGASELAPNMSPDPRLVDPKLQLDVQRQRQQIAQLGNPVCEGIIFDTSVAEVARDVKAKAEQAATAFETAATVTGKSAFEDTARALRAVGSQAGKVTRVTDACEKIKQLEALGASLEDAEAAAKKLTKLKLDSPDRYDAQVNQARAVVRVAKDVAAVADRAGLQGAVVGGAVRMLEGSVGAMDNAIRHKRGQIDRAFDGVYLQERGR